MHDARGLKHASIPMAPPALQEARRMLSKRLPVPAYDHLLKLSHTFNLLDGGEAGAMTGMAGPVLAVR